MPSPRLPLVAVALLALPPLFAADAPSPAQPPRGGQAPFGQQPSFGGGAGFGSPRGQGAQPAGPPKPYLTQPGLGGLRFDKPLALVSPPGETNRLFVLEQDGKIFVIPDLTKPEKILFLDLTAEVG